MIPLGKKEGSRLEFKGADALKDPEKIAREVVAMLNAEGGEVWVGLREDGGRAVAVEPIADPEAAERRLRDFLVDTIEPSVSDREVRVQRLDEGEGAVLRVSVAPEEGRRPYAFLRKGGRHFVIRVGDRIRPMTREEVFSRGAALDRGGEALEQTDYKVVAERRALIERHEEIFWLRFEPAVRVSLDIQDPRYEEFLQDPPKTGNRRAGWNFAKFRQNPHFSQGKMEVFSEKPGKVEVRRDGGLVFALGLKALYWKGEKNEIWPFALVEYVVSAFRIARSIYQGTLDPHSLVVVDFALIGLKSWILRPGTPGTWFLTNEPGLFREADDFVLTQPLVFHFEEIAAEPDRCGYRLIERVYEAFGFRREAIPEVFDPQSLRLILPE